MAAISLCNCIVKMNQYSSQVSQVVFAHTCRADLRGKLSLSHTHTLLSTDIQSWFFLIFVCLFLLFTGYAVIERIIHIIIYLFKSLYTWFSTNCIFFLLKKGKVKILIFKTLEKSCKREKRQSKREEINWKPWLEIKKEEKSTKTRSITIFPLSH